MLVSLLHIGRTNAQSGNSEDMTSLASQRFSPLTPAKIGKSARMRSALLGGIAAVTLTAVPAHALNFVTVTGFGGIDEADFNGDGIPNDPLSIACTSFGETGEDAPGAPSISDSGAGCLVPGFEEQVEDPNFEGLLTLALGASPRPSTGQPSPPFGTPSDGVYTAEAGTSDREGVIGSKWNFNTFIDADPETVLDDLMF